MSIKEQIKKHILREENRLHFFVILFILMFFSIIWFWIKPPFEIGVFLTVLLLISLYYQIMSIRYSVSTAMIYMKIEDKSINEMTYQVIKRGHEIVFYCDEQNKMRIKRYSCSKNKMRWIKCISFIHVALKPAWMYREDVDEIIE